MFVMEIAEPSSGVKTYLRAFDVDAHQGRGSVILTRHVDCAKTWRDRLSALEYWQQTSKKFPVRPDGKPNRPLTAYTVSIVPVGGDQ